MTRRGEPGSWDLVLDPRWTVFSYFGGTIAACTLRAAQAEAAPERAPLWASTVFTRPVSAGPARADVEVVGKGRRLTTATARLSQGAETAAILTAVFGPANETGDPDPNRPRIPAPAELPAADREPVGQDSPRAHLNVDWRCATRWGNDVSAWIRPYAVPRAPDGALDPAWIVVACDLLGPAVIGAASTFPFYTATVALTVQFIASTDSTWLQQRVLGGVAGDNAYGTLELWDEHGLLVARAHQQARLLPAEPADLPYCVTAFGSGSVPPAG